MNPRRFERLIEFCTHQYAAFDVRRWLAARRSDREALAVAAKFLSMTSWYGFQEQLADIAERLDPRVATPEGFEHEAAAMGFLLGDFALAIRSRIHAPAAARTPTRGFAAARHGMLGLGVLSLAVLSYVALRGRGASAGRTTTDF